MGARFQRRYRRPVQLHWLMLTLSLSFVAWIVIGP